MSCGSTTVYINEPSSCDSFKSSIVFDVTMLLFSFSIQIVSKYVSSLTFQVKLKLPVETPHDV